MDPMADPTLRPTGAGRFGVRYVSEQTLQRTQVALQDSVWLHDEMEFTQLVEDGEQIEGLVLHLRAAKKLYDQREGRNAERDYLQYLVHALTRCIPAPSSSGPFQKFVTLLKPALEATTQSSLRTGWDALQLTLLLATLVSIPVRLAHAPSATWDLFAKVELCVDIVLALDIPMSACTPFYTKELGLIMDPGKLLEHYLSSTLLLDVVLAFPFGTVLLYSGPDGMLPLLRVVQMLRVLKATKKAKSVGRGATVKQWLSYCNGLLLTVLYLFCGLALYWHWMGCVWWFIITHDGSAALGFHASMWCVRTGSDATALTGQWTGYLVSIHWAAAVTTCVGTPPLNVCSSWQSIMEALTCATGVVLQSAFFGAPAPPHENACPPRDACLAARLAACASPRASPRTLHGSRAHRHASATPEVKSAAVRNAQRRSTECRHVGPSAPRAPPPRPTARVGARRRRCLGDQRPQRVAAREASQAGNDPLVPTAARCAVLCWPARHRLLLVHDEADAAGGRSQAARGAAPQAALPDRHHPQREVRDERRDAEGGAAALDCPPRPRDAAADVDAG